MSEGRGTNAPSAFVCDKRHTHATAERRDRCNRKSGEWRQRRAFECPTRDVPERHIPYTPPETTSVDTSGAIPVVRFGTPRRRNRPKDT